MPEAACLSISRDWHNEGINVEQSILDPSLQLGDGAREPVRACGCVSYGSMTMLCSQHQSNLDADGVDPDFNVDLDNDLIDAYALKVTIAVDPDNTSAQEKFRPTAVSEEAKHNQRVLWRKRYAGAGELLSLSLIHI